MAWKDRLRDLALAGGLAAGLSACSGDGTDIFLCNANPDPCCARPDSTDCAQWNACIAAGGVGRYTPAGPLGSTSQPECFAPDGGVIPGK
jgi:hypothetical protein